MSKPVFRTADVSASPALLRDAPYLLKLFNAPENGSAGGQPDITYDDVMDAISEQRKAGLQSAHDSWIVVLRKRRTRQRIGFGTVTRSEFGDSLADVGLILHPAYQRRGYGPQVLRGLASFAFNCAAFRDTQIVTANINPARHEAVRLMAKAGFQAGALHKGHYCNGGVMEDTQVYYLSRESMPGPY
ncbi:MAG: GNAT family N-acetyltransferase [Rhodospirillales bacterium]|nr:GNAT family N-acetyltransferase [Alphaproteobacteria bacterium]MCB9987582.1 GNAT family N-acetyltransferase [Rhodospirillales bacterium]USO07699.1 MAG: GNAT family N-acetyltransferase [Rhodospirillales bacterium]